MKYSRQKVGQRKYNQLCLYLSEIGLLLNVFQRRKEITMRGFVVQHKEEGLRFVSPVQPCECFISGDIGSITLVGYCIVVHMNQPGLKVQALSRKHLPIIKTGRQ